MIKARNRTILGAVALATLGASLALAQATVPLQPTAEVAPDPLAAPHLPIVPRTPEEAERIARVTVPTTDFAAPEPFEGLPAGAATVRTRTNADAFSQASANISFDRELDFKVGNGLFRKLWVAAPSSTLASDGLGPLYNARGCQNCHLKDGRGHPPPEGSEGAVGMFLRISIPAETEGPMAEIEGYLATLPDPTYGGQLQDFGTPGHRAEYRLDITYEEIEVPLSGGESASLRRPTYRAADLAYGPLHAQARLSPRLAPQMIGLGLLEAVPAADILTRADPDDADGDGISGRANVVWSREFGRPMLGRFGHKAGVATIREQAAAAFAGDIGISSSIFPDPWGDCMAAQAACRAAPHGDDAARDGLEIDDTGLDLVTFYSRNLAVPARRDEGDAEVLRGKRAFYEAGCISCHTPKHVTNRLGEAQPEQSFQLIWPYTDLLLHDMGEGLADHRPEARATGTEWRTAPLWGIGLTAQVNGHDNFLHDGRARTLLEAILWHGGEAQASRDRVVELPKSDRDALIRYLESL
jgi:CxxC motif-containing protein (DUF1111 family)